MKFLFLVQYFPPEIGAAPVRLWQTAKSLIELGHQVEVITSVPNYPTGKIFPDYKGKFYCTEQLGAIKVHRVWTYPAIGAGINRMLNYISFFVTSLWCLFKVSKFEYIFVESPPPTLMIAAKVFSTSHKAKVILNLSDLWPDTPRLLGMMKPGVMLTLAEKLEVWCYSVADFISTVTEGLLSELRSKKGINKNKLLFLPNGVDLGLFGSVTLDQEARDKITRGDFVFLYAGTHSLGASMETIIRSAQILRDEKIKFLFVGDGPVKNDLIELSRSLGLNNCEFLDPVPPEKVALLYEASFAGVSSLRNSPLFEGTRPAKIFACMGAGRPIIYSGSGEGARLVEDAQAGLVVPPEDPIGLANAILGLTRNTEHARQLGRNGRKFVEDRFSWSVLVKAWIDDLLIKDGRI